MRCIASNLIWAVGLATVCSVSSAGEECDIGFIGGVAGTSDWLSFEYVTGSSNNIGLTCEMNLLVSKPRRNGLPQAEQAYYYRAIEQDQSFVFHLDFDDVNLSGPVAQELVFFEATRTGTGGEQEAVLQLALAAPNDQQSIDQYQLNVYWFENNLSDVAMQTMAIDWLATTMAFKLEWNSGDVNSVVDGGQASVEITVDGVTTSSLSPFAGLELESGEYRWGYIDASSPVRNGTSLVLQQTL